MLILHITRVSNEQNLLRKNAKFRENFRSYLAFFYENKFSERKRKRCGISWKKICIELRNLHEQKMQNFPEKNPENFSIISFISRFCSPKIFAFFFLWTECEKIWIFDEKTNFAKGFPNFTGKPTPIF